MPVALAGVCGNGDVQVPTPFVPYEVSRNEEEIAISPNKHATVREKGIRL